MTDNDRQMSLLLDAHRGLPRQGPGDDASTLRALELCADLPMQPEVLDVGCGPGMQTMALAQATGGTITAVDLFEQFLDDLRDRAVEAGVRERIQVMRGDMRDLPFGKHSFDLIWSEGAAYIMGIVNAFQEWKQFLRPQGYIAVTEISWLVPEAEVPRDAYDFFRAEYPGITDVPGNLERIAECGYEIVGHFTLPDEAWWTHYYDPLARNLVTMRERYRLDPQALLLIEASEAEQRIRRESGECYGYEFIVARHVDPDVPLGDASAWPTLREYVPSTSDAGDDDGVSQDEGIGEILTAPPELPRDPD
jgi:SAM-dependent methyltransferase